MPIRARGRDSLLSQPLARKAISPPLPKGITRVSGIFSVNSMLRHGGVQGCRLCDKADNRRVIVSPSSQQNTNNQLNLLKSVFGVPLAFL